MSKRSYGGAERPRANNRDENYDYNDYRNTDRPDRKGYNRYDDKPIKVNKNKIHQTNFPGIRFYASLLTSTVEDLTASKNHEQTRSKVMKDVCERADVDLPKRLPLLYNNSQDYYDMQTSLILEESRYKLAEALADNLLEPGRDFHGTRGHVPYNMELVDMEAPKKKKVGFTLQFEIKINGRGRVFTMDEVICMKPGSIFEVTYNGGTHTPAPNETVKVSMLACITPSKFEFDTTRKTVVSLTVFPVEQLYLRQGTPWKIKYLTTLISEQRQFEACIKHPKVAFIDTLLGWDPPEPNSRNNMDVGANKKNYDASSPVLEKEFLIPKLNTVQEKVAIKFLNSPSSTITLVQGPPGTGKTTFLASLLCRSICSVRNDGSVKIDTKKRILVTAPTNKAVLVVASKFLTFIKETIELNVVMIGVENKLVNDDDDINIACDDPFTIASLSPSLRSIFVYTWLDELTKEYRSFGKFLHPRSFTLEKRRILINRASILTAKLHRSLPCIVEKTGSLYWAQEFVLSLKRLPTDLSQGPNHLTEPLTKTRKCLTSFIEVLDQIERFDANQELLDAANVIFCTLSTSGVAAMRRTKGIDDLFVDEAAAASEPEVIIPFHLSPLRMLAVGDPKQLPATVMSRYAIDCGLDNSLIGRLMYDCAHSYTMLDKQYRMRPEIRSLPSQIFYDGKIRDGDNVLSPDYKGEYSILEGKPYSFLQVRGEEQKSINHSYYNVYEAQAVLETVRSIYQVSKVKGNGDGIYWHAPEKVRIITFYSGQVSYIRRLLTNNGLGQVLVATVDSSQGCEADIVIISFVRSNQKSGKTHSTGFLQDQRRLNVALTRAKYQLICIGDGYNTLLKSGVSTLQSIVNDVKRRGLISDYKKPAQQGYIGRNARSKNEYNGHANERRNLGTPESSNINSDYIKTEQRSTRNNVSANANEYTGYRNEPKLLNNSNDSSNNNSNNYRPEPEQKMPAQQGYEGRNARSKNEYNGHANKQRNWGTRESSNINSDDIKTDQRNTRNNNVSSKNNISANTNEYTGYRNEPELSNNFNNSSNKNSNDYRPEPEQKKMRQIFPMKVSSSMSVSTNEYTGYIENTAPLNDPNLLINSDYNNRELERKGMGSHNTPSNGSTYYNEPESGRNSMGTASAKEYKGYMENTASLNNSNLLIKSDYDNPASEREGMGSHNIPLNGSNYYNEPEPGRNSMGSHNIPSNGSNYYNEPESGQSSMGSHNIPLNGSNYYNEPESGRNSMGSHNTPGNMSTSTSAFAHEYTGYAQESNKHQNSREPSQKNNVRAPTINSPRNYSHWDNKQQDEQRYVPPNDQYVNDHERSTVSNGIRLTEAEKHARKMELMKKISLLQKEIDDLDKL